jgi:SM-20-related protein
MPNIPERIASGLATRGWYVGESIFTDVLAHQLGERARLLEGTYRLQAAHVGRGDGTRANTQLRNDDTHWLESSPDETSEHDAMVAVHALRAYLNEALFLGAGRAELHFARYAPGAFYRTHRDRFRDDDARMVSLVFYLNDAWSSESGGRLVLYTDDNSGSVETRVDPAVGTMVCFLSDRFPHEVLPALRERYSLTGWLCR